MELVTDPATNNTICQETWDQVPRLIYGGFTNITQVHNLSAASPQSTALLLSLYSHLPPSSLVTAALSSS